MLAVAVGLILLRYVVADDYTAKAQITDKPLYDANGGKMKS